MLRNRRFGLALISAVMLLATILAVVSLLVSSREANKWVEHTNAVIVEASGLMAKVVDAEASQRGYIIGKDKRYLDRYRRAASEVITHIDKLTALVGDNPGQQEKLVLAADAARTRLARLEVVLAKAESGAGQDVRQEINLGPGAELMDALRRRVDEFAAVEQRLLLQRSIEAARLERWLYALIAISLATAAATLSYLVSSVRQLINELTAQKAKLEIEASLRRTTEETLRQAQKMEAVGQLTGGIAHDFNNLLTIILGNLDTIRRRAVKFDAATADAIGRPLESAVKAGGSAAKLTHRLLAFSRQQALEPVIVDMNVLTAGMTDLLRRTVGEAVEIEAVLAAGLWKIHADANQLENAILNLVVNARDAMPNGGKITIETSNAYLDEEYVSQFGDIKAGQYVLLSVSDNGTGIAPEIMERIFEPFFTTKGVGKGTGLGLAMIHGFAKQSGGHVRIYSETGQGTTFKAYFPRHTTTEGRAAVPRERKDDAAEMPRARATETILVVEDNAGVREFAVELLKGLGYQVLQAENAEAALQLLIAGPRLDLVFTDIVMPGAYNGRELADKIRAMYPAVPILFTTGFTRNAVVHNGRLDANVELIHKPYAQLQLARKLREIIDARQRG